VTAGRPRKLTQREQEPGDEQVGGWPREQLTRMNDRFVERLETAKVATIVSQEVATEVTEVR
jgi:hypothetical protein